LSHPDDSNLMEDVDRQSSSSSSSASTSKSQLMVDFISIESQHIIRSIRQRLIDFCFPHQSTRLSIKWLPCHVIDLKSDGKLMAHVDSIRFSGHIVAGLCLGSSAIMRLKPSVNNDGGSSSSKGYNNNSNNNQQPVDSHYVDMYLPPRTLYVLRDAARYEYSHELLPDSSEFHFLDNDAATIKKIVVRRDRRISVIFRDAKLEEKEK
jgi:alkylated DNA repair protein alkB family protein 7